MGPVRQNPIQRTVSLFICVCIALFTIVAHNIAQNRPDNFPPYPPDNHHNSDDVYLREGGVVVNTTRHPEFYERNLLIMFLFHKKEIASDSENDKQVEFAKELPPKIILSAHF